MGKQYPLTDDQREELLTCFITLWLRARDQVSQSDASTLVAENLEDYINDFEDDITQWCGEPIYISADEIAGTYPDTLEGLLHHPHLMIRIISFCKEDFEQERCYYPKLLEETSSLTASLHNDWDEEESDIPF